MTPHIELEPQYLVGRLPFRPLNITRHAAEAAAVTWQTGYVTELLLHGRPLLRLGVNCSTCGYFFERVNLPESEFASAANLAADLSDRLQQGLSELHDDPLRLAALLFPGGHYLTCLLNVKPQLIQAGSVADPLAEPGARDWTISGAADLPMSGGWQGPYYLAQGWTPADPPARSGRLCVQRGMSVILPMQEGVNPERVAFYEQHLRAGRQPTALAMLNLIDHDDIHGEDEGRTTLFATFALLDGHHKVQAAANLGIPLNVLVFWPLFEGEASAETQRWLTDVLPHWQKILAHY